MQKNSIAKSNPFRSFLGDLKQLFSDILSNTENNDGFEYYINSDTISIEDKRIAETLKNSTDKIDNNLSQMFASLTKMVTPRKNFSNKIVKDIIDSEQSISSQKLNIENQGFDLEKE